METLNIAYEPIPNSPGVEGHGEGVEYKGKVFYYRAGKKVPKNKVVSLAWEGDYANRVNGDKEYIIVGYVGDDLTLIDTCHYGIRENMKKFKGMTPQEALEVVKQEAKEREALWSHLPDCKECGSKALVFESDQPKDLCLTCYQKSK